MGDHLLSANSTWNAYDLRAIAMGIFSSAKMGRSMGKMVDTISYGSLLWSYALLRRLLCLTLV